jgi:hypothetical protein
MEQRPKSGRGSSSYRYFESRDAHHGVQHGALENNSKKKENGKEKHEGKQLMVDIRIEKT